MKSRERGNAWPIVSVAAGAFIVLVIIPLIVHRQRSGYMATVDPHVTIGDAASESTARRNSPVHRWPDNEVARTAERLRDATAVAIAATSNVIQGSMNRRIPPDAGAILSAIVQRQLIPSEWLTNQPGVLKMPYGTIHLRYSPKTLGIEVICVPHDRNDGPAILIRIPDQENTGVGLRYFESMQLDGIIYPTPFAPIAEIIACGWQPRLFKHTQMSDAERAELEQWVKPNVRK